MKKMIFMLFLLCISSIAFSQFKKIPYMEKKILGFEYLNSERTFEQRLDLLERKVFGETSKDSLIKREEELYDLLFLDGKYFSPFTKVGNLEKYLFNKKNLDLDLLTRIEKLEENLYSEINNKNSVLKRITDLYSYLLLTKEDFINTNNYISDLELLEIKAIKKYKGLKKDQSLYFILKNDIDGVAKSGSLVIAKVISRKRRGIFDDEKVIIVIQKIINEDKRELDIYKKIELIGNKRKLIGGDKVIINDLKFIG